MRLGVKWGIIASVGIAVVILATVQFGYWTRHSGGSSIDVTSPVVVERLVEIPRAIAMADAERALRLASRTALSQTCLDVSGRSVSPYDLIEEPFPETFQACVLGVTPQPDVTNGPYRCRVKLDWKKLSDAIEQSWVSVSIEDAERKAWRDKRRRLREAVCGTERVFADYPSRLYKATRIGMFEVGKGDRTDSTQTSIAMNYEMAFRGDSFADLERGFRTAVEQVVLNSKTVTLGKSDEPRRAYETFWKEAGHDRSLGYRIVAFLDERPDESRVLRMLIVPAQIHRTIRKSISDDSTLQFTFRMKGSANPLTRCVRTELSFWCLPYTDFANSDERPIEFHSWMTMEIDGRDTGFVKREIRQSFEIPVDSVKLLDRCDIRAYSGKQAEDILKKKEH